MLRLHSRYALNAWHWHDTCIGVGWYTDIKISLYVYYRRERITPQALWTLDNNHNFHRAFAIPTIFEGFLGISTILVGLLIFNPTQKNLPVLSGQ